VTRGACGWACLSLLLSNVFRPAVQALCKALSIEPAGDGVQVNVLAPGRILTERSGQLDEAQAKRQGVSVDEIPRGRGRSKR